MSNKKRVWIIEVGAAAILLSYAIFSQFGHFTINLPVEHKVEFTAVDIVSFPSNLQVAGNQIKGDDGQVVVLKGVMAPDPAVLKERGLFDREQFAAIQATHANVIRIPVHPEEWVNDKDYLWRYLDPVVRWAGELKLYVIIDWHYIGNIATGAGEQMPDIKTSPKVLTMEFWRSIANYFRNTPNVIFEIFNEPASIEAEVWRSNAVEIIQLIRHQSASQVIIVGGIDFSKDLSWVKENPIQSENIAYASHIYPAHSRSNWSHWFGGAAEKYPVMITEWGFMDENRNSGPSYLAGDELNYGEPLLAYLDDRGMGWIACWYDDRWLPTMFTEDRKGYTRNGEFILQELSK